MMQYRRLGRTEIFLSVIGYGTCQLQMVPEQQAIETLKRGFELGINWVHTSPDYGGVEHWIARAIKESGRNISVLSQGPADMSLFELFFENTCKLFQKNRLEMYGINCIDDLEYMEATVWGSKGMVEYLLKKKEEGRLGGIFCTTHGSPDYVANLIKTGIFDAIVLAYNPLGFHQLTYFAKNIGREYECLPDNKEKIFPLAAKRHVGLLIMKPLAGGLLCRGKAFPPHEWPAPLDDECSAGEILKYILNLPGVCAVMPGMACREEVEENAQAGYKPIDLSKDRTAAVEHTADKLRSVLCSRCGLCESTCSKSLPISSMFREAYIWNYRNELFMASEKENYFSLHSNEISACRTCSDITCQCPQGIDIPEALSRIHDKMHQLAKNIRHPGPPHNISERYMKGNHEILILYQEVPQKLKGGEIGICRFLVENVGDAMWTAYSHIPDYKIAMGIRVVIQDRLIGKSPIRQNVCPGQRSPFAFTFRAPRKSGDYELRLYLAPLACQDKVKEATLFYSGSLAIEGRRAYTFIQGMSDFGLRILGLLRRQLERYKQTQSNFRVSVINRTRSVLDKYKRNSQVIEFVFKLRRLIGPKPASLSDFRSGESLTSSPYGIRYLEHTIPDRQTAGVTYGVQISARNTGQWTWRRNPSQNKPLLFMVFIDDKLYSVLKLPRSEVHPGEKIAIHFALRAPYKAGKHEIRLEPVVSSLTWFFSREIAPFKIIFYVIGSQTMNTLKTYDLALKHNPWYYLPTQGIHRSRDGRNFPLFISQAKGCKIWDSEGREYIDFAMGWGSTLLGHADVRVQNAIRELLDIGPMPPFPHPVEMDVSRMIVEDFPCAEMVVFGKNGSDVCTVAARMARLVSGKRMILSCGFHGWQDFALEYFSFSDSGIPEKKERYLHKFRFNDKDDFFRLYHLHKKDLAAVIIEPSGPWVSDYEGPAPDADKEFLQEIARATRKAGALLIFDEIITCYRYLKGSVQKAVGVIPDLACLGKALASGMPLAALVGSSEVFHRTFPKTHYCPTFKGEIYSLAAAKAAIQIYRNEPVAEYIWRLGEKLRSGIDSLCRHFGISAECKGPPFRMALMFKEKNPDIFRLKKTLYIQELLKEGVVTANSVMLPSYAHDEATLEKTLSAIGAALEVVAKAEKTNSYDQFIEIPLL